MFRLRPVLLALPLLMSLVDALPAAAQRSVAGVDDDEEGDDEAPKADDKKADDKKADDKKADDKKADDKKADDKKADDKKADDKKADDKKAGKKADDKKAGKKADDKKADDKKAEPKPALDKKAGRAPDDILEDTEEDKKKRSVEDEARKKAEAAAAAADAKKAAEKARLDEEKRIAAEKKLQATRDQRLASARAMRTYRRTEGEFTILAEVTPGAAAKGGLVEVRLDIFKQLEIADPKFGTREPQKNLKLVANVIEPTGKKDATTTYAVHPGDAPGHYGFHFTPNRDGVVQVQITGGIGERSLAATIPLHIGVWPPPDFDEEDKKLTATR